MSKKPLILGIESSCDETAASIITENEQGIPIVLSNIVSSQVDVHKEFGGVVPELAARSHMEKIDWIVQKAIDDSGRKIEEIDAVASTAGPGSNSVFICWFKFWKSICFCFRQTIHCC
jgi:N6-L-threonylcarbamoyladenine synthase